MTKTNRRALILTALPVEYRAALAHLEQVTEQLDRLGTVYQVGAFNAGDDPWMVCVAEIGAGNQGASSEVERAVQHFSPQIALFVGVAGGLKDVAIGDVVFATKVYGYESGKESPGGFLPRLDVGQSSYRLSQRARAEARSTDWCSRAELAEGQTRPRALVAPLAAGEKVIASTMSSTYRFLRRQYDDAVAVEMEGRGFLRALHPHLDVDAGIVRGISDLLSDKPEADAGGSQEMAARNAAAFAFQILAKLSASTRERQTIAKRKGEARPGHPVPPLSYGAVPTEFMLFAKLAPPPKDILAPQDKVGGALPALEFVKGPGAEPGEYVLPHELREEVLIHTTHAGCVIPTNIVADSKARNWCSNPDQEKKFEEEKDWGANQLAQAIADELGLDGYLRVNVARCVLDFGRFPGVSPSGVDHLNRLSVSAEFGEQISREKLDALLKLYHQISSAFERAVWTNVNAEDGSPKKRPRQIILGVHTFDRFNREGTLRPSVSLISRSRTYDLNHTMHPGSFDRLFPDELAEFSADRCLVAAIAHAVERERISVDENHPYSMPDGCVEIRSQVWYFFKFLQRRFEEVQNAIVKDGVSGLSKNDFERVWSMLLDTTLRHTESASLRSYIHEHRVPGDRARVEEFQRYLRAYEAIVEFRNREIPGKSGRAAVVDEYRLIADRPSSLGLEVRKDLVWKYHDPVDDLDPRRIGWQRPLLDPSAVIEDNIRRIARLIAAGIREYLVEDKPKKKKAKELVDPYNRDALSVEA